MAEWTEVAPKEPGYYWWLDLDVGEPEVKFVFEVSYVPGRLFIDPAHGDDDWQDIEHHYGLWWPERIKSPAARQQKEG